MSDEVARGGRRGEVATRRPLSRARVRAYGSSAGFFGPALILIFALVLVPSLTSVVLSFQNATLGGGTARWVGFANYRAWFNQLAFPLAMGRTLEYIGISLVLDLLIGFGVALLLNQSFRGRGVVRAVMLIPWVLPVISSANIWLWMLNPTYGIVDTSLMKLGLMHQPVLWFSSPTLALFMASAVAAWRGFPFMALVLLAGLQGIPAQLYEAAKVDGAKAWSRFRHITMPGLLLVLIIVIMLHTIFAFNDFSIYLLTQGGPGSATQVLAIGIYQTAFQGFQLGQGTAGAILEILGLSVIVAVYLWFYIRQERQTRRA